MVRDFLARKGHSYCLECGTVEYRNVVVLSDSSHSLVVLRVSYRVSRGRGITSLGSVCIWYGSLGYCAHMYQCTNNS